MIELIVLTMVGLTVLLFAVLVIAVVTGALRLLLWLVLLPLKVLVALLVFPARLLVGFAGALLFLATGPLLAATAIVAAVVIASLFSLPLAPILLLLFGIWLIGRASPRPEPATRRGLKPAPYI
jgi:hypothetical protein